MTNKRINVLLVEDDRSYAGLVQKVFEEKANYFHINIEKGIRDAKLYLDEFHPDLIIADLFLLDGKGI